MASLFGTENRIRQWRRLWVALAEAQKELGLPITEAQVAELRAAQDSLNLEVAARYERQMRHDVMAQLHAYGDQCPTARGILHLGATSCYVTDNADLMLMREALNITMYRVVSVLRLIAAFAQKYAATPCLAFTHLQPAQPTTVGKRAMLWAYDLVLDLEELQHRTTQLKLRGVKGTTGTQASFLQLFHGDHDKVRRLEQLVIEKLGFEESYPLTGQTYPRKVDSQILDVLSGIAQSAHKLGTDIRILAHRKEIEEPFEPDQIGSSAMAYKRNPMRSERICSLARFVMSLQSSPAMTAATQWFERTLDDSANRRLVIPQAFLAIDAVLVLLHNVVDGLAVYEKTIERNLREELPFMATESILMAGVEAGGDRQFLHERIRQHSQAAAVVVKCEGLPNDLMERLAQDPAFQKIDLKQIADPKSFTGRAEQQVLEYLSETLLPLLAQWPNRPELTAEVNV